MPDDSIGELVAAFVTSKTAQQAAVTESAYDLCDAIRNAQQTAARPAS